MFPSGPGNARDPRTQPAFVSPIHRVALVLVWLMVATSGIVFSEPAPVDLLMLVLVLLLPVAGLIRATPALIAGLALWLAVGAATVFAMMNAIDAAKAVPHAGVTIFLFVSAFVLAAFVMYRPEHHTRLIFNAYILAAVITALAGVAGYFNLVPGAFDLFTRYGRATGTFKDPNVYGPFLVPPLIYVLHRLLEGARRSALWLIPCAALLAFAILLSFSRGAWVSLGISIGLYACLAFITASTNRQRFNLAAIAAGGIAAAAIMLVIALQFDEIGRLFGERAALTQSYDEGPEGRFGGQHKAIKQILANPFGIGPQQFAPNFHFEEAHNVYLTMFLNAGWIGGGLFLMLTAATVAFGLRHALRRSPTQPLFLVAYACFTANAVEGFLIDYDHWRHVFLLMAVVLGLMLGERRFADAGTLTSLRQSLFTPTVSISSRPARPIRAIAPAPATARATCSQPAPALRRPLDGDDNRPGRHAGRRTA